MDGRSITAGGSHGREEQPVPGLDRRRFLTYLVAAPVLTVAARAAVDAVTPATANAVLPSTPDLTDVWDAGDVSVSASLPTMPLVVLEIGQDGRVRLELPRLEMGQGLDTACAIMIAEELDVAVERVDVQLSKARPELLFNMVTGASAGVRTFHAALPLLAAGARAQLLAAAAERWNLSIDNLRTRDGEVIAPDGRSASYGSLSAAAAMIARPDDVSIKSAGERTVVGVPTRRLDAIAAVTGRKKYAMDLDVPGALPVMVCRPPTINGTVKSVNNAAEVEQMPGVIGVAALPSGGRVVPTPPGVAVMAETFGQAWDAVNALDVTWGPGPIDGESNETIWKKLRAAAPPFAVPPPGAQTVEAEFEWAPAAHAPLEPETAVADVREDRCEIWAGLQSPIVAQQAIAEELGLSQDQVIVHVLPTGGSFGFGRRLFWDGVQQAVHASKLFGRPAKLMYHRTDDMRHTRVRPPQFHKVRATILGGQVASFEQRVASVSLDVRHGVGEILTATAASFPEGSRHTIANGMFEVAFFKTMVSSPYNFGLTSKELTPVDLGMSTCSYRSVPIQPARGVEEIMVDELAAKLGKDPVAFRLEYLRHERAKEVLRKAAEAGEWGKPMRAGFAQGVGVHQESRSLTACVVELDCRDRQDPRVRKAAIVVDVGLPLNPLGIKAQMEGGLAEAISLTLRAGLHIKNGLPLEGSYSQYHFARQRNFPTEVNTIIMPATGEAIGGAGEVGMSAPTGAIANAYAKATGIKPRRFPLIHPVDFEPIPPGKLPQVAFE